jgi:thiamine biosynthesis lipoprotein
MRKYTVLAAAALLFFSCSGSFQPLTESRMMLGTVCSISIHKTSRPLEAAAALKKAFNRTAEIESMMSLTLENSEIRILNEQAGIMPYRAGAELFYLIERALFYFELTEGCFDISLSPLVDLWGINKGNTAVPSPEKIAAALQLKGAGELVLDSSDKSVFLPRKGMALDPGGIAKGYAADEAGAVLEAAGVKSALIDFGGNIKVIGKKPDGSAWKIGIQDPLKPRGEVIGLVFAEDETVVTSGKYERFFIQDGKRYHHIINPETGQPAESGIESVTIVGKKSTDADALSTALLVAGMEKALIILSKAENAEAVLVAEDGRIIISRSLKNRLRINDAAARIEYAD